MVAVAIAVAFVTVASPARADGESYRAQTAIVDVGSLALAVASSAIPNEKLRIASRIAAVSGLVLGSSIVHAAHGNYGRAGGALALRVGPPALTALMFAGCDKKKASAAIGCALGSALVGAVLVGTGIVLDYAVLGGSSGGDSVEARPVMFSFGRRF